MAAHAPDPDALLRGLQLVEAEEDEMNALRITTSLIRPRLHLGIKSTRVKMDDNEGCEGRDAGGREGEKALQY